MSKIKHLFPWYAVLLAFELVIAFALRGPLPAWFLPALAIVFVLAYPAVFLLDRIPVLHNWILRINDSIKNNWKSFLQQPWKKIGICLAADLTVSAGVERIIDHAIPWNWRVFVWCFVLLVIISLLFVFRKELISHLEVIVFVIILSIGTLYVTTVPVSCGISWDDETHFHWTLQLSHQIDGKITGGDAAILNQFANTALNHELYSQDEHSEWLVYLEEQENETPWLPSGRISLGISNWCYIPAAVGLAITRAMHLPYSVQFVFGKWMNLFVYALLVYGAIKKLKSGKLLAASVALLPPCILMASSYSRDPWMIAWIMYGFSYLIGEIQTPEKKIKLKDILIILFAFAVGTMPKAIYAPLILICLFIPKSKFESEKKHKIYVAAVIGAVLLALATFMLPFVLAGGGSVEDSRGGDVNAAGQTAYILSNPFGYAKMLLQFLLGYFSLDQGRDNLVFLHYFGTAGHGILIEILLATVALTDRDESDREVKWGVKVATLITSLICIVLAATAMYVAFTPYMASTILGCQYRYILQILFPVLFILGSVPIQNRIRKDWYRGVVLAILSWELLQALWNLCIMGFRA